MQTIINFLTVHPILSWSILYLIIGFFISVTFTITEGSRSLEKEKIDKLNLKWALFVAFLLIIVLYPYVLYTFTQDFITVLQQKELPE